MGQLMAGSLLSSPVSPVRGVTLPPGNPLSRRPLSPSPVTMPGCKEHPGSGGEELLGSLRRAAPSSLRSGAAAAKDSPDWGIWE